MANILVLIFLEFPAYCHQFGSARDLKLCGPFSEAFRKSGCLLFDATTVTVASDYAHGLKGNVPSAKAELSCSKRKRKEPCPYALGMSKVRFRHAFAGRSGRWSVLQLYIVSQYNMIQYNTIQYVFIYIYIDMYIYIYKNIVQYYTVSLRPTNQACRHGA